MHTWIGLFAVVVGLGAAVGCDSSDVVFDAQVSDAGRDAQTLRDAKAPSDDDDASAPVDARAPSDDDDASAPVDAAVSLDARVPFDAARDDDADVPEDATSTVLDLNDVKTNPDAYTWFDFRPNVKKLILSGAAETEHVAILWYTTMDGGVGLHYHSKTESVYVIDGSQTDGKGVYPTGAVYFNPPGSGHQVTNSSGFFLLAYASPPDFMSTGLIGEYTPIRIDTTAPDLLTAYAFEEKSAGVRVHLVPLDAAGGMEAELVEVTSGRYTFTGNYLVVLKGSCEIAGTTYGERTAVVAKAIEPQAYAVAASGGSACLALGVSF